MDQSILTAIATLRATLPEGGTISLMVHSKHHSVLLQQCAAWMREQGAVVGPWYGFSTDGSQCQRNLEIKIGDMKITGCETNLEAGITIGDARLENEAAKAALAA